MHQFPQVICVHPLVAGKPFPTMYWLTCPFLRREISTLEAAGEVGRLEALMKRDRQLHDAMHRAHERYIQQRNALLSAEQIARLEAHGLLTGLMQRGIGGIREFSHIKCLHVHVAHALVDENPVGKIVRQSLPREACSSEERICSAYSGGGADRSGSVVGGV